MEFLAIVQIGKFSYLFDKIVEVPFSVYYDFRTVLIEGVSGRNRRDKTTWPSFHHGDSHFKELFEPPDDVDFPIFVLAPDQVDSVLCKCRAFGLISDDRYFDFGIVFFFELKGTVGVLSDFLMVDFSLGSGL